LNTKGLF